MTETTLREQVILDAGIHNDPFYGGSRITNMLNQAQDWLQLKLIKQGFRNWRKEATITLSNDTLQGLETAVGDQPADRLYDMDYEQVFPATLTATLLTVRPMDKVEAKNFYELANNAVLAPDAYNIIYIEIAKEIHTYPRNALTVDVIYSAKITDLAFGGSTESEIPKELHALLVERVVMQTKSNQGNEQVKQAKKAEIDQELSAKYQLDALKEKTDKGVTQ